jgi:hypothetical protein
VSDILDLIDGAISNYEWTGNDAMRWTPPGKRTLPVWWERAPEDALPQSVAPGGGRDAPLQAALSGQPNLVFEMTGCYLVEFWTGRRPVISRVGTHQILIGTFRLPLPTMESIAKRARLRQMHTAYHRRHR